MLTIAAIIFNWLKQQAALFVLIMLLLVAVAWFKIIITDREETETRIQELKQEIENRRIGNGQIQTNIDDILKEHPDMEKSCRLAAFWQGEVNVVEKRHRELREKCPIGTTICQLIDRDEIARLTLLLAEYKAKLKFWQAPCSISRDAQQQLANLHTQRTQLDDEISAINSEIDALQSTLDQSIFYRMYSFVERQFTTALLILIGIALSPLVIRGFLYFCIAPFASRIAPVKVLKTCNGSASYGPSSVSLRVQIPPDYELLVRNTCLKDRPKNPSKNTQWILNRRLPLTSLAAGMYFLTSIKNSANIDEHATVSSSDGALDEVLSIDIPAGSGIVLKPHCMVGVLKHANTDVNMTRHWRLGSLHSWITLRLRYLVLHGPCQVIVRGCRGVRVETPSNDNPRLIQQSATIGFGANLDYSNQRSEVFFPYLMGDEDLFMDQFQGESAQYFYAEAIGSDQKSKMSKGLESVLDAILNVLGV